MTSKIPQGSLSNVTGDSRVKKIRFNKSGTVDVVVLDKPKRNPKPKKKRARKTPNAKRTKKRTGEAGCEAEAESQMQGQ